MANYHPPFQPGLPIMEDPSEAILRYTPPMVHYEDYTNPMGGWGWDGTEQMPEIVEAALDGDLDVVKMLVRDVKNNSKVTDKAMRLLVNGSQHLRSVVRDPNGGEDTYVDHHGMTALTMAANLGNFEIVKYLLANFADPTLKGRSIDGTFLDAYEAADQFTEDEDTHYRIKDVLEEARPFWKAATYCGADYSDDRVKMGFPNEPTDHAGLLHALATFEEPTFRPMKKRPKHKIILSDRLKKKFGICGGSKKEGEK